MSLNLSHISIDETIVKALCYADIFNFPLTIEEIVRFAPKHKITIDEATDRLNSSGPLRKIVKKSGNYYYLQGRKDNCKFRKKREASSKIKLIFALRRLIPLQGVPFLRSATITGALAALNSPDNDDIDLLIISAPERTWSAYFFLRLWRYFCHNPDVCFNIFLSQENLHLLNSNQNFFYAREILGGITIFDESKTFSSFLEANPWVYDFFPSFEFGDGRENHELVYEARWRKRQQLAERLLSGFIGDIVELFAYKIQFKQMAKSGPGMASRMHKSRIKLHKSDNRPPILNKYEENIRGWLQKYEECAAKDKKAAS